MIYRKNRFFCLPAVVLTIALMSGCVGQSEETKMHRTEKSIIAAIGSETGGLDPAGNIANTFLTYSVSALDELLTFDEDGNIEYRAAKSYEVNEDYTQWTFHLREDAHWSDGTPVTASDFLNTIKRALNSESGSGYSSYLFPIEHAEEIYQGEMDMESLGVETPDDDTILFHLKEPCVYFLQLLRLPVYMPSCGRHADAADSGWDKRPETSLSNGPFYLEEYVAGQYFVLKKNENYWNAEAVHLQRIKYLFFEEQQSMLSAYEAGEVDIAVGLPSAAAELYRGKEDLMITDNIATRYIYPNLNVKPLDDVRVRKAVNLAINRDELCKMAGEETEASVNFVAKYMKNEITGGYFVEEAEKPFTENVEEAQRLLAQAGYPDGKEFPVLTYKYPALELDSDVAQIIQEQLKQNLNIEISLQAQELQTNYSDRRAGRFELCRMNWTADFADPYTYLSMLVSNGTYNCSGVRDERYDQIVGASAKETDILKRNELLHEAELYAVGEQFYIIPLFSVKSCNLVRPDIEGLKVISATGAVEYRYADVKGD